MSLPLTRRIARAALLVAAGAAPVIGAAGSASAVDLPAKAPVGAPSAIDTDQATDTVEGKAHHAQKVAGKAVGKDVEKGLPTAGEATEDVTRKARGALGDAAVPDEVQTPTQELPLR